MAKLNEMIRDFRNSIGQTVEGLALLMDLAPEEYEKLEEDWIPPDDVLERLCALFEWNFVEVRQLARRTPSRGSSPASEASPGKEGWNLAGMLREAREAANQPTIGIATLIGVPVEMYESFEAGEPVPEDVLQRLCMLFRWNFHQLRQRTRRQNPIVFTGPSKPLSVDELRERLPPTEPITWEEVESPPEPTLGERLQATREQMEQSVEGVALLLGVSPDYYELIESGSTRPDDDLLRQIAAMFRWNYNELRSTEQKQRYKSVRPSVTQLPDSGGLHNRQQLREVLGEITKSWSLLSKHQRESLLLQLELVRDTARKWSGSKTSAPLFTPPPEEPMPPPKVTPPPAKPAAPEPAFRNNVRKPSELKD
jgi:transcriptional regulator with XRE-family HTH domain